MEDTQKIFLTAGWYNLVMVNYEIDPSVLRPYLPFKTELDFYDGKCIISLVGFNFMNTKLRGIKFPFHTNFEEVNLRFYVKCRDGNDGWKRGVVFLKEIVPRTMIAFIANTFYKEKYVALPMKHDCQEFSDHRGIVYQWKAFGEWNYIKAYTEKNFQPLQPGSQEQFIADHYWGYTFLNDCCTGEYKVEHPSWNAYKVNSYQVHCNFEKLYGPSFKFLKDRIPFSVFVADGSEIIVRKGIKIR
jgi:hypothetical protein